jgi:putative endonuclease
MSYWVYVLINPTGKIYIGHTDDLPWRLSQHNDPAYRGTLYMKRHPGPWRLVQKEQFATCRGAMCRERELKTSRGREWIREQLRTRC